MANLNLVLFPGKILLLLEKLVRHHLTKENVDNEANKPVKEKKRKRRERGEKSEGQFAFELCSCVEGKTTPNYR